MGYIFCPHISTWRTPNTLRCPINYHGQMPKPPPENNILSKKKQSQGQKWLTVNRKWNFWDQWYAETCLVWINALLCITLECQIILVICITFIREMWINSRPLTFVNNRGGKLFLHAKSQIGQTYSVMIVWETLVTIRGHYIVHEIQGHFQGHYWSQDSFDPGTIDSRTLLITGHFDLRILLIPGHFWSRDTFDPGTLFIQELSSIFRNI